MSVHVDGVDDVVDQHADCLIMQPVHFLTRGSVVFYFSRDEFVKEIIDFIMRQ